MKEDLEAVERFIAEELGKGTGMCPTCKGHGGLSNDWGDSCMCDDCKGSGKSPHLRAAESALEALRRVREREKRLRAWATKFSENAVLAILNDQEI